MGPLCIKSGLKAYRTSKELKADGKVTIAQVTGRQEAIGLSNRKSRKYWVTVSFVPEGRRAAVTRKVLVDSFEYSRIGQAPTIRITYLESNAGVIRLSDKVETECGLLIAGCLTVLGSIGYLVYACWRSFRSAPNHNPSSLPEGHGLPPKYVEAEQSQFNPS